MRSADDADELRGRLEDGVVAELGGAVGGGLAPDSSGSAMLPGVDCWTLLLCCSAIWCGAALPLLLLELLPYLSIRTAVYIYILVELQLPTFTKYIHVVRYTAMYNAYRHAAATNEIALSETHMDPWHRCHRLGWTSACCSTADHPVASFHTEIAYILGGFCREKRSIVA